MLRAKSTAVTDVVDVRPGTDNGRVDVRARTMLATLRPDTTDHDRHALADIASQQELGTLGSVHSDTPVVPGETTWMLRSGASTMQHLPLHVVSPEHCGFFDGERVDRATAVGPGADDAAT